MNERPVIYQVLGWLVTVMTPLIILMTVIRLLITPVFARIEYRMPGFPEDPFGFTLEDRLRWSAPSIRFLVNRDSLQDLAALEFSDGEPIYNERELSHMQDVKELVTIMRIALWGGGLILAGVGFLLWRKNAWDVFRKSLYRGGWGIVGLVAAILIFVALNFENLFTWFHQLFFESGTWMFYTSDTLIRLFPMRFWQDAFIFVGGGSLLIGILLIAFLRRPNPSS
jgi:integral membrane protein (TIGR01906 family)